MIASTLLFASLATASFQDSLRPILPGWGRCFWNQKSVAYQHPPAFDFTNVANAVAYRFDILDDRHDRISFVAARPTESLAGVWTNVAARGLVTVTCQGVDASGRDCGAAGPKRTFWKSPPFDPAKCEPGARPYAEAALKQYEFVFSMPHIRKMVETGKLDYTYEHNCYPTKMNECLIGSALHYAELKPSERGRALEIARAAADCLIDLAEPEGAPLAGFTPTYAQGSELHSAGRFAGQHMLLYPATAGGAFVKLYRATKDEKYLSAARRIADTYLRLQGEDGTWYLKLWSKDGKPVNTNLLMPFCVCDFLLALAETTGEAKYRACADRAFAYVEKGPLANWNWEGQFEDVKPSEPYQNLTHHPPCEAVLYLLSRYPGDKARLAQARALLDFCEDQFVFWERPCRADGTTVRHPRLEGLAPKWPILPVVLEQYGWYVPVNASLAKMIRVYLAMYRAERNPLDLAKAKALGDACTRAQCDCGCIPSEWMGEIDKTIEHTTWINCQIATAEALEDLAAAVEDKFVFAIRHFQSDRDVAEVSNVIVRAAKAGYTGLVLVSGRDYTGQWWDTGRPDDRTPEFCAAHAALDSWWVMSPDRQRRVKEVARLCKANGLDLVPLVWSVGYNSMRYAEPEVAASVSCEAREVEPLVEPLDLGGEFGGTSESRTLSTTAAVASNGLYVIRGEVKTEHLHWSEFGGFGCGARCVVSDPEDNGDVIAFVSAKGKATRGWTPFSLTFASGRHRLVKVEVGRWWDDSGSCAFRNLTLQQVSCGDWVTRGGETMTRKWFADRQSSACMSDERLYAYFKRSAAAVRKEFAPRHWFLSMDEIRVDCECAACRKTPFAERLGRCLRAQYDAIRAVSPDATVYVWSDMIDPGHNCRGGDPLAVLPKDVVIAIWDARRPKEAIDYFAGRGHRVLGAGYYDLQDAKSVHENYVMWKKHLDASGKSAGLMYTTWAGSNGCTEGDYRFLEDFR